MDVTDSNASSEPAASAIKAVVSDVLRRRARGEPLPDSQVMAENPGLMPQLRRWLAVVSEVSRAQVDAGGISDPKKIERILDDTELEAPIGLGDQADEDEQQLAASLVPRLPRLPGYVQMDYLGSGGQATVFRAVQNSTGRVVAIKVMAGGALATPSSKERFQREAHILGALSHPNIVAAIDTGLTPERSLYLVMPFIRGLSLDTYVNGLTGQWSRLLQVLSLMTKVVRAVDFAHRHGVLHRDLKPSNVLVDERGEPLILDFGLARLADDLHAEGTHVTVVGNILGSIPG